MNLLNRDEILAANDRKTKDVPVPEWGGVIRLAVMSGTERDAFHSARESLSSSLGDFESALLAATIVGADGRLIFSADDIKLIRDKNKDLLDKLAAEAAALNGIGTKAQETAEKNSEAAPSGDSGSVSHSTSE